MWPFKDKEKKPVVSRSKSEEDIFQHSLGCEETEVVVKIEFGERYKLAFFCVKCGKRVVGCIFQ